MPLRILNLTAMCLVLAAALPRTASPKQSPAESKLTLGEPSAPPGSPVTVPITLAAAEGTTVGGVEIRLSYPKAQLTFIKVEPSGLTLAVEAKVEATVVSGLDAKSSTVKITIATPADAAQRKPLPAGLLGYARFTIAKTAKPDTVITLSHEATAQTAEAEPKSVSPLTIAGGKITVATRPVPACFFYMH